MRVRILPVRLAAPAFAAGLLAVVACGSAPPPMSPVPPPGHTGAGGPAAPRRPDVSPAPIVSGPAPATSHDGPGADPAPPGGGCTKSSDCKDGEMCDGPEGCGTPWRCVPSRACTKDLRPYCGCDGKTFQSSGSCAGRPYKKKGEC